MKFGELKGGDQFKVCGVEFLKLNPPLYWTDKQITSVQLSDGRGMCHTDYHDVEKILREVTFESLEAGDRFHYSGDLYIKTDHSHDAVDLKTGHWIFMCKETKVIKEE